MLQPSLPEKRRSKLSLAAKRFRRFAPPMPRGRREKFLAFSGAWDIWRLWPIAPPLLRSPAQARVPKSVSFSPGALPPERAPNHRLVSTVASIPALGLWRLPLRLPGSSLFSDTARIDWCAPAHRRDRLQQSFVPPRWLHRSAEGPAGRVPTRAWLR